jgi:hypothetical protein
MFQKSGTDSHSEMMDGLDFVKAKLGISVMARGSNDPKLLYTPTLANTGSQIRTQSHCQSMQTLSESEKRVLLPFLDDEGSIFFMLPPLLSCFKKPSPDLKTTCLVVGG